MKKEIFANLVNCLIEVEPSESPIISCFVNLEHPRSDLFKEFEFRASLVRRSFAGKKLVEFDYALDEIKNYLNNELLPSSRSVAIYSRWGHEPVFLTMQFEVPLENEFIVDELPHIYPLIELKDTYHRFVVTILTEGTVRILETTIGAVTEDILEKRPRLRSRIGREWTKEHYRSYCDEQANRFVKEQVEIIETLMERGGHNHLILAGSPGMVARMKKALPDRLASKVIDTLIANPRKGLSAILADSMKLFIEAENVESHDRVAELELAVLTNGLGVCGYESALDALYIGAASILVIDQDVLGLEMKEELVKMASACGIPIETVNGNDAMVSLGGVGCLLRYQPSSIREKGNMLAA